MRAKKIVKTVVILFVMLNVGLYFFQEKLIFHPEKLQQDYKYTFDKKFEEVNLKTDDNSVINALHFKVENPKGIILYFHGNKGNLQRWGNIVSPFTDYDYDVFVIDYRGYGKSVGKRNEENLYSDAQQSYEYVQQFFSEDKIVIYGRSLGATFASYIASKHKPNQLILEAPFYNLIDAANFHYPYVPAFLLKYKFTSDKYISKVTCPITIFHGIKDKVISYEGGKKLFEKATVKNKEFITINDGNHHNLADFKAYKDKIKELLNY